MFWIPKSLTKIVQPVSSARKLFKAKATVEQQQEEDDDEEAAAETDDKGARQRRRKENDRKLIVKSSLRCASFKVRVNIINFDQYVWPVMSTRTHTHTLTVVHSFVCVLSSLLSLSHCSHSQCSLGVPCGADRVWLSRLSIGI